MKICLCRPTGNLSVYPIGRAHLWTARRVILECSTVSPAAKHSHWGCPSVRAWSFLIFRLANRGKSNCRWASPTGSFSAGSNAAQLAGQGRWRTSNSRRRSHATRWTTNATLQSFVGGWTHSRTAQVTHSSSTAIVASLLSEATGRLPLSRDAGSRLAVFDAYTRSGVFEFPEPITLSGCDCPAPVIGRLQVRFGYPPQPLGPPNSTDRLAG